MSIIERQKWKSVEYSRSKIIKSCKVIKDPNATEEQFQEALSVIDNWRAAHAYPLHVIYMHLRRMTYNRPEIVVAERLKRLDSIINKLSRESSMSLGWFNGEHITYDIPNGVTVLSLKYRETGYNSSFCGDFKSDDEFLNSLWQKSLRTLYVMMRDNYMDCPDRERAQWWGDATIEMIMSMYSMDSNSYD